MRRNTYTILTTSNLAVLTGLLDQVIRSLPNGEERIADQREYQRFKVDTLIL